MKKTTLLAFLILISIITNAQTWNLGGNSDATTSSFLGTSTNFDLVFRRNNVNAGRITETTRCTSFGVLAYNDQSTGNNNTANGYGALNLNTTGASNSAIGSRTLQNNTIGIWNTALARNALNANTTGNYNTASGVNALTFNVSGHQNTANGMGSLQNNTTGNYNTSIGVYSLVNNTIGQNNTAIGYYSNVGSNNLYNATAIGANSLVSQDNSIVLGSISGINGATSNTNVGIGTNTPNAQFHTTGTVKLAGLTLNTSSSRILVSDIDGNLAYNEVSNFGLNPDGSETKINSGNNINIAGVGTQINPYVISAIMPVIPASQWIASTIGTGNIINSNSGGVIIGTNISTLPSGYKMYVQSGILTEKIKVALKSGSNWADYVFKENYKLIPLSELETFVKKNKHLPGVKSADQIISDGGIDVREMLTKQMEKIEELTLYMIDLDKKIKKLEMENKLLKKTNSQ